MFIRREPPIMPVRLVLPNHGSVSEIDFSSTKYATSTNIYSSERQYLSILFIEETPYWLLGLTMRKEPSFLRYCETVIKRKLLSKGPLIPSCFCYTNFSSLRRWLRLYKDSCSFFFLSIGHYHYYFNIYTSKKAIRKDAAWKTYCIMF